MASEKPKSVYEITDFQGITISSDLHDQPPGVAADQVNCQSQDQMKLDVRRGLCLVSFEA